MYQKLLCLMDRFRGDDSSGTEISTSWDSNTKEGRKERHVFFQVVTDVGVGRECNIRMFPSFRVCSYTHFPSASHHCLNNPKSGAPVLPPAGRRCTYSANRLEQQAAKNAKQSFKKNNRFFPPNNGNTRNKDGPRGDRGISCRGVTMALAVGCCKHPTESPRTKHQLPVKDVYSSPDCQLGWRRLCGWGSMAPTCKPPGGAL